MRDKKGFTLIELLIVIAIIAILAAVVFVALDPLTRFQDARDSARWTDITALVSAIKVDQVDNGGSYLASIAALTAGTDYMIGTAVSGCDGQNANCAATIGATNCVNLSGLATEGYLGSVPISPQGSGTWTAGLSGYYLNRSTTGAVTVAACEAEGGGTISVTR